MTRPSKYTQELKDQIAGYIKDGLTIRDACFGAGISEDTFWRWNQEKLEFAEAIKKATISQKWSSEALARTSGYRRYARKAQICPSKYLIPIKKAVSKTKEAEETARTCDLQGSEDLKRTLIPTWYTG